MLKQIISHILNTLIRTKSNCGKWSAPYANLERIKLYGDPTTYEMAAAFFSDVNEVEDWGCGGGGFRKYCKSNYVGVDGTPNPYVDHVTDLVTYTSDVDGILLRHVLEHNPGWEKLLHNAVRSIRRKLCIILFTPFVDQTRTIRYYPRSDIVDIAFNKEDLIKFFDQYNWRLEEDIKTSSQYGIEHVFFVEK